MEYTRTDRRETQNDLQGLAAHQPPVLPPRTRPPRPRHGGRGRVRHLCGLPIALSLFHQGKQVQPANLSFSALEGLPLDAWLAPDVAAITPESALHQAYFPERTLARRLALHGYPSTVHAFSLVGVQPLRAAYRALIEKYDVDAVVLVDGGTDILMPGDESGLGTPEEDLTSAAALATIDVPERLVVSIGFGIDAYRGVSHGLALENIAALERDGSRLGLFSVSRNTRVTSSIPTTACSIKPLAKAPSSSTRWRTRTITPPTTPASSTGRLPQPPKEPSGTYSSPRARVVANSSSTL